MSHMDALLSWLAQLGPQGKLVLLGLVLQCQRRGVQALHICSWSCSWRRVRRGQAGVQVTL